MNGRSLLVNKLNSVFRREVFVGTVKTRLPFDLIIKDVEVKDLFKIGEVFAQGGVFDILGGNFILPELRIKRAVVNLEKPARAELQDTPLPQEPVVDKNVTTPTLAINVTKTAVPEEAFKLPNIILRRCIVSDSIFNFVDRSVADRYIKVTVKDVNIKIENLELPVRTSEITYFELTGKIPWQNIAEEGKIWFQGWINFFKKDMRAELKIGDIDGVYLHPYYSNWVDLEKSRIQKAKLNFFSEIVGLNNDVTADCHLELTRIEFKPRPEDQPQEKAERIATAVIDIFKAINEGKIVLDFKFKTKMDNPEFGLNKIIKMAVQDKIKEARKGDSDTVFTVPGKIIGGTISSATDLTKALINGTMSVGKELKKAIEGSFIREVNVTEAPTDQAVQESNQTKK
jgi:hypothetical protein